MFLDHTQRRSTVGRTPLDEWSARRRDLYLTTDDTHNRQTSMPPVETVHVQRKYIHMKQARTNKSPAGFAYSPSPSHQSRKHGLWSKHYLWSGTVIKTQVVTVWIARWYLLLRLSLYMQRKENQPHLHSICFRNCNACTVFVFVACTYSWNMFRAATVHYRPLTLSIGSTAQRVTFTLTYGWCRCNM